MIENICYRKGWLGDTLADGGIPASEKIGKDSFNYLIQVKGMSNLHSDERATPALALNIATASRGSDHLRSRPAIDLYNLPEHLFFFSRASLRRLLEAHGLRVESMRAEGGVYTLGYLVERLRKSLRSCDIIGRPGGDEFVALVPDVVPDVADTLATRLANALDEPYVIGEEKLECAASIGLALYPKNANTLTGLMREADQAMYRAKARSRSSGKVRADDLLDWQAGLRHDRPQGQRPGDQV